MIYNSILDTIGNTPVVRLNALDENSAKVYVKLEYFNPGGSVKDRIAEHMVSSMEQDGQLKKGMTIVSPTSGNTGIGLAMVAAQKGYDAIFVMPETMSKERRQILKAFGAQLILTNGTKGMNGAVAEAKKIVSSQNEYCLIQQFENKYNPEAHMKKTAYEILSDFPEGVDIIVSGVGTGGTITGIATVFKKERQQTYFVAVEPKDSPVLSGGHPGPHKIQGIGAGFVPSVLNRDYIDEVRIVSNEEAIQMSRHLARKEGLFLGISSGAAIHIAYEIAAKLGPHKKILVIAPDHGERYLTTNLYEDEV